MNQFTTSIEALNQQLIEKIALRAGYYGLNILKDLNPMISTDEDILCRSRKCYGSSSKAEQCSCGIKILVSSNGSEPDQPESANLNTVSLSNYAHQTVQAKIAAITSKLSRKEEDCEAHIIQSVKRMSPYLQCTSAVLSRVNEETKGVKINREAEQKPKLLSIRELKTTQQLISDGSVPERPNLANLNPVCLSNYAHQTVLAKTTTITQKCSQKKEDCEAHLSQRIKMVSPRMKHLLANVLKRCNHVCNVLVLSCQALMWRRKSQKGSTK